jgi:hypothetical protein
MKYISQGTEVKIIKRAVILTIKISPVIKKDMIIGLDNFKQIPLTG